MLFNQVLGENEKCVFYFYLKNQRQFLAHPTENLTEFSHVHSSDGLNKTLLSQGYVLETAPSVGMVYRTYILRTGKGMRGLQLLGFSSWINRQSHPLDDLLQHSSTPRHFYQKSENFCPLKNLYKIVIATLWNSKNMEMTKMPSVGEYLNKLHYIHYLEYYSARKGTNYFTHDD